MGLVLYLWRGIWVTTMFPLSSLITIICIPLAVLLIVGKIILYDRYSKKSFIALILAVLCVMAVLYQSRNINPVLWLLLVVGAKDVPFKKILKVYLVMNGAIVILAFASSMLGVIENLQYEASERGVRNSFGIIYPTDFASHVFFLILAYYYLNGENLNWKHYLGTIVIGILVYYFCKARLDSGCIILVAAVFGLGDYIQRSRKVSWNVRKLWNSLWSRLGTLSMLIFAAVSIGMTAIYGINPEIWKALDKILSSRLRLGNNAMKEYGIKPFGQIVEMVGNGVATARPEEYSFIDCSYVYILMRYGVVFAAVVLGIFTASCLKNRHDRYFLYAVALVAVNCTIAHHILQVEYNPFALALLGVCVRSKNMGNWPDEGQKVLRKY